MHSEIKSIQGLVTHCKDLQQYQNDLIVDTKKVHMINDSDIEIPDYGIYKISNHASSQIASRLRIPKRFFDELPNRVPGLKQKLVNDLMHTESEKRMLRLDETPNDFSLRAFLSDRYRRWDNLDALQAMLPTLQKLYESNTKFTIKSANVSDKRMYLQIMFDEREENITVNDPVCYGVIVTNSEIGAGAWNISEMVWRLVCSNGMISGSLSRRHHVGNRLEIGENGVSEYLSNETLDADLEAQRLTIRDIFKNAVSNADHFQKLIEPLKEAVGVKIEKPKATIEKLSKKFAFNEETTDKFLENFFSEGDMSKWGVINGVTALAHQTNNPDEQYSFEQTGGQLASMNQKEWMQFVN
tara:strand:- start:10007 stop:11071 length:1065 start_codon:yes stop_codon:yes gene_type:complete